MKNRVWSPRYALACALAGRPEEAAWDLAVGLLYQNHSLGVDEGEQSPPPGAAALRAADEYVAPAHATPRSFVAYFGDAGDARQAHEALEAALADLHPRCTIRPVEERDHSELWKAGLTPIEVNPYWRVRAPWHEPAADPGRIDIVIDPGMAFGTGSHESTRACLELLAGAIGGLPAAQPADASVLDFGCGSGILAIALKKLGVGRSIAVDIDPLAIEATVANAALNSVQVEAGLTLPAQPPLDGIVANILKNTLIELAASFYEWLKPGAFLILAGLLAEQEEAVQRSFARAGFVTRGRLLQNDWVSLLLVKPPVTGVIAWK